MHNRLFLIAVVTGLLVGFSGSALATHLEISDWVAKLVSAEGRVESMSHTEANWTPAKLEDTYFPEDRVRTLEKSRAAVLLKNESILRLDQRTTVKFSAVTPEKPSLLELIKGRVLFFSRFPRKLLIDTPFVNAASEGTEFLIEVDEEAGTTTITVLEGQITAANEAGSVTIQSGQAAVARAGERPVLRIVVRPRDSVQWALYYPPVLSIRDLGLENITGVRETDWRSKVRRSIDLYREGDLEKAFSALEGVPEDVRDPRLYTYRASLLLSVGRVEEARSDIEKALMLAPGNGLALALESIIAVVQNEKDRALELGLKAVGASPESASVKIALSYAHQANFDLPEALEAAQVAVRLDPQNSLAWARLAELWMGEGDLDKALEAAKRATDLNPREARSQTVLGFAYLTQIKTSDAKAAFEKAITLNSADPLPRLGLGLANIREGDLEEGRKEIEIAVSLDPNNALIRSYLGKAYYEEKRDSLAEVQLKLAKELDPKDPTPYLYDAIRKQTINQPVEALHDIQESIKLNDNRAVYRSRLLLDDDLASRSVSLGRIYDDLGFQQLGLVEGWKSVNIDPANYSAHRFLADSYATLPRSEIARVSEQFQAQMLQPINNNPVRPRLGESAPGVLAGAGPVDSSFNEFSQLFIRDRFGLLGVGVWGENSTLGGELIHTGLQKWLSYSIGAFHNETAGYRTNADMNETVYDIFTQASVTHKTSVQAEFRSNDFKRGDLESRFDLGIFSPTLRRETEEEIYRAGFHHTLPPHSDILGSFHIQDAEFFVTDSSVVGAPPGGSVTIKSEEDAYIGELQYLFHTEGFNLIAGGGHFESESTDDVTFDFGIPGFPPFVSLTESDNRQTSIYLYSYINLPLNATLTIGGSGNFYEGVPTGQDQFNPKFGLIWNLTPTTTLRMAGFRALTRPLVSSQSLEPTQVAGFQQFFDDGNGTDSRRYGIGIDQKISESLFGGLEVSKRDAEIPIIGFPPEKDEEERLARAYLYWTPISWLAASTEYQFERLDSNHFTGDFGKGFETSGAIGVPKIKTHLVPLGFNLFHPCGFFTKVRVSYADQEATPATFFGPLTPDEDNFWIVDASVGYRLPKRLGIFRVEAKNLFDQSFKFFDSNPKNPIIQPGRLVFIKLTLSF